MAITGKTFVPITPAELPFGGAPELYEYPEGSSQTGSVGAPVAFTSGYIKEAAANATLIFGFLEKAGQNTAADGDKKARVFRAAPQRRFTGSLDTASFTQAMIGSVCNLVESANTWYLDTSTSISSVAQCVIVGLAKSFAVGDADPEVIFIVEDSKIQYL
jgi:hypothetical protein